jgi:hypothetical protein
MIYWISIVWQLSYYQTAGNVVFTKDWPMAA